MVRYPHSALVTVEGGSLVEGEWVAGNATHEAIQGRFESTNSNSIIKHNSLGNEVVVRGQFFTKCKKIDGASTLTITAIALDAKIICWEQFQTHSVINV